MNRSIEIFSGTGGVGKTTLAASRAYHLSKLGKKVLLITIDPSKRLKEVLKITDENSGEVVKVNNPFEDLPIDLSALLMNPEATVQRISKSAPDSQLYENRIVKILARPNGGLNEILALVELNMRYRENLYDVIVLDTPPGGHFLDFLESSDKIESFFDKKFIEIFKFISNRDSFKSGSRLAIRFVASRMDKLLNYLEKVTGAHFVRDFIEAVGTIYKSKDAFLDSLELKNKLKDPSFANWFLVTSVEHNKVEEALTLFKDAKDFLDESTVLLNKCMMSELAQWQPKDEQAQKLKASLVFKEEKLKETITKNFKHILEFKEIVSKSPQAHIRGLEQTWQQMERKL